MYSKQWHFSCIRKRSGEGKFHGDVDSIYHNMDNALWRDNWKISRSYNDAWPSYSNHEPVTERPSLPLRNKDPSSSQHSRLSRKRTASYSDESTDHSNGCYDNHTSVATHEYIATMDREVGLVQYNQNNSRGSFQRTQTWHPIVYSMADKASAKMWQLDWLTWFWGLLFTSKPIKII